MRQHEFQSRHEAEWNAFSAWLDARARSSRRAPPASLLEDEQFPQAYRRICQHYALAQARAFSSSLIERLRDLVERGHVVLYRPPPPRWRRILQFLGAGFPHLVRANAAYVAVAALLFFLPLITMALLLQWHPELVHTVFDAKQLVELEAMYDPADESDRLARDDQTDVAMFGYYIFNNISIGFRSFASGLLGALGPVFILLLNGVVIGSVVGHLTAIGYGGPLWRFVVGHSAPELIGIVISGAAGLRIGMALIAPGQRSRSRALVEDGRVGARLMLGVFAMLLFAAFVEAFWSSIAWIPDPVKFGVGAAIWLLIVLWLARGGRGLGPDPD